MSFDTVSKFENLISDYFNAPFAVATDSCTHALELSIIYKKKKKIKIPNQTYVSIPMLPMKLGISFEWEELNWKDYYYLSNDIIDAAVFWKKGGYVKNTLMCLSFQFKKHINIGRGGMILTDDKDARDMLIKLSYDGREREKPWMEQNISHLGYHYYLTPESAAQGIEIFNKKKDEKPKNWSYRDYPVLNNMKVFK